MKPVFLILDSRNKYLLAMSHCPLVTRVVMAYANDVEVEVIAEHAVFVVGENRDNFVFRERRLELAQEGEISGDMVERKKTFSLRVFAAAYCVALFKLSGLSDDAIMADNCFLNDISVITNRHHSFAICNRVKEQCDGLMRSGSQ